jgi:hypothetical protein
LTELQLVRRTSPTAPPIERVSRERPVAALVCARAHVVPVPACLGESCLQSFRWHPSRSAPSTKKPLAYSLNDCVRRHESLRTTLPSSREPPGQGFTLSGLAVLEVDLRSRPQRGREDDVTTAGHE